MKDNRDSEAIKRINNFQIGAIVWLLGLAILGIGLLLGLPVIIFNWNSSVSLTDGTICSVIVIVGALFLGYYTGRSYWDNNQY